jgi:hypothetical protein
MYIVYKQKKTTVIILWKGFIFDIWYETLSGGLVDKIVSDNSPPVKSGPTFET